MKIPWKAFEHKIHRELAVLQLDKTVNLKSSKDSENSENSEKTFLQENQKNQIKFLIACSGGSDSVALLRTFWALKKSLRAQILLVHVHHGDSENKSYRDKAKIFCQNLAESLSCPFYFIKAEESLYSESALRKFRRNELLKLAKELGAILVMAHHQDDLLETRLMRLIRGTGVQGLRAIPLYSHSHTEGLGVLRPFLKVSKKEILNYLEESNQNFLEDPSNKHLGPLRNWLRQEWLPLLEKKNPGSMEALFRSLETIVQFVDEDKIKRKRPWESGAPDSLMFSLKVRRSYFNLLTISEKMEFLAYYLRSHFFFHSDRGYTQGQIKEILKHLDKAQGSEHFVCAGLNWHINAEQFYAENKQNK